MGFFRECIPQTPKSCQPSAYEDVIYPVHKLDDTSTFRNLLLAWTISFNDVMDAEMLRSSLARLLEIGDWRKLGGRLKLKENGALEIHVPRMFTADRPAFSYSHEEINMGLEDHEATKNFPKYNGDISFWPSPHSFQALAAPNGTPKRPKDLCLGDTPQMSLHITAFTNATLIAITWPHTLMDIMGQQALLHAWSLVLQGRDSEVPPVLGAHEDALSEAVKSFTEKVPEYNLKPRELTGSSLIKFVARYLWDLARGPKPETQTVCLPFQVMAALRLQAQLDIATSSSGEKPAFVSDGDILAAWAMRAISTSLPRPRPMTALHVMNARFRMPQLNNAPGIYLQNMILPAYTFLSAEETLKPLGTIAVRNRQHLAEQATEAQVLACLREQLQAKDPSRLLYSDANALPVPFTNWTKADLLRAADFHPAVVRAGDGKQPRYNPPGTPIFHHVSAMKQSRTTKLMIVIMGKDHEKNYWLTMTLPPVAWEKVKASLEELRSHHSAKPV
ncbi:BCL5p [Stagonosporopsis vannaccii]|nr:BCL5p [Stagonosporopsis vannaccii]